MERRKRNNLIESGSPLLSLQGESRGCSVSRSLAPLAWLPKPTHPLFPLSSYIPHTVAIVSSECGLSGAAVLGWAGLGCAGPGWPPLCGVWMEEVCVWVEGGVGNAGRALQLSRGSRLGRLWSASREICPEQLGIQSLTLSHTLPNTHALAPTLGSLWR